MHTEQAELTLSPSDPNDLLVIMDVTDQNSAPLTDVTGLHTHWRRFSQHPVLTWAKPAY